MRTIKIFTINYAELAAVCDELDSVNPDRTKSYLDLLRENIEKTSLTENYQGIIPIEIDYSKKLVSLLGDSFPPGFVTFDRAEAYEEKLIEDFDKIFEMADDVDAFDRIFKLIKTTTI